MRITLPGPGHTEIDHMYFNVLINVHLCTFLIFIMRIDHGYQLSQPRVVEPNSKFFLFMGHSH